MARIPDIERRIENWARWKAASGSGFMGYAGADMSSVGGQGGYREAVIPISDVEASETDGAIQRLPNDLRITVFEMYLGRGGQQEKLNQLGIARTTMNERIDKAQRLLSADLAGIEEMRRRERARVEALQRMAKGR